MPVLTCRIALPLRRFSLVARSEGMRDAVAFLRWQLTAAQSYSRSKRERQGLGFPGLFSCSRSINPSKTPTARFPRAHKGGQPASFIADVQSIEKAK